MTAGKIAVLIGLPLLLFGCANREQQARDQIEKTGIEYSEKGFFNAIAKGETEAVDLFLKAGMSPNAKNGDITALMEAARRGKTHSGIAAALVQAGSEVNAKDAYGVTPLLYAAISGSPETLRMLLKSGADVNAKDADGRNVLVEALTTENDLPPEIYEELIQAGADVNARTYQGMTPLLISAAGNPRLLRALISAGADVNARDDRGLSALTYAQGSTENIQILRDAGAKE